MRKLKLIWDFRGPDSSKIAEHHLVHLKQYISMNHLDISITGTEALSDLHHIAFLVCTESEMPVLRDSLKPHRGQVFQA